MLARGTAASVQVTYLWRRSAVGCRRSTARGWMRRESESEVGRVSVCGVGRKKGEERSRSVPVHTHTHEHTQTLVAHARCERAPRKRPPLATAPQAHVFRLKDQQLAATVGRKIDPSSIALTHACPDQRARFRFYTLRRAHMARYTTTPDKARLGVRVFCNVKQNRLRVPHDVQPLATPPRPPTPQRGRKGSPWLLVDP
jgi:hypothetical protein